MPVRQRGRVTESKEIEASSIATANNQRRNKIFSLNGKKCVLFIFLLVALLSANSLLKQFVFSDKNKKREESNSNTPQVCALFSAWGRVQRYDLEIGNSMAQLKALNPQIFIILATDTPSINHNRPNDEYRGLKDNMYVGQGVADYIYTFPPEWEHMKSKGWMIRVKLVGSMSTIAPHCDVVLSLDSHVTTCSSNLYRRILNFYNKAVFTNKNKVKKNGIGKGQSQDIRGPLLGTNVEHNSGSSGLSTWKDERHLKEMPHNFAIIWVKSKEVDELFKVWIDVMERAWMSKDHDDQWPLLTAIEESNFKYYTRIEESFFMAFKSFDKAWFKFYPRFTYLIGSGEVSLVHSYEGKRLPSNFTDFCKFLNSDTRPRMVFQEKQTSSYELITDVKNCKRRLSPYDSRICADKGFLFGSKW